jgi:hypothetical protein
MCSPSWIPKVEGVALDEYEDSKCHTYCIPKDRGEICQCWYDEIAALPGFLILVGLHALQLVRGEGKF